MRQRGASEEICPAPFRKNTLRKSIAKLLIYRYSAEVVRKSRFMNTWPQPVPPNPSSFPASLLPLPASATTPQVTMNQKKILVVDDSAIIRKTLSMKLKASGYEVLTAEDGSVAVSTARRERPDLILLDISFPPDVAHGGGVPWDGFLIMGWLKRMDEAKDIPI